MRKRHNQYHILIALLCLVINLLPPLAFSATTVLLWPIDPIIPENKKSTELWIENKGTSIATLQVRIVRWQQEAGFERYQPQQDVVATPPISRIGAGSKQLIRLIRQNPVPAGKEFAYRIIVDEIPQPNDSNKPSVSLKLQMRYSIPLFVYGPDLESTKKEGVRTQVDTRNLSWGVVKKNGKSEFEVRNQGNVHVRLSQVSAFQNGVKREIAQGLLGYVLPGERRSWPLPSDMTKPTELTATINAQDVKWRATAIN